MSLFTRTSSSNPNSLASSAAKNFIRSISFTAGHRQHRSITGHSAYSRPPQQCCPPHCTCHVPALHVLSPNTLGWFETVRCAAWRPRAGDGWDTCVAAWKCCVRSITRYTPPGHPPPCWGAWVAVLGETAGIWRQHHAAVARIHQARPGRQRVRPRIGVQEHRCMLPHAGSTSAVWHTTRGGPVCPGASVPLRCAGGSLTTSRDFEVCFWYS